MKKTCCFLVLGFAFSFSSNAMEKEKIEEKKSIVRVVVDKKLMTQACYNEDTGTTKILIRDPKSKVKEFYIFQPTVEILKRKAQEIINKIPTNQDHNDIKIAATAFYTAFRNDRTSFSIVFKEPININKNQLVVSLSNSFLIEKLLGPLQIGIFRSPEVKPFESYNLTDNVAKYLRSFKISEEHGLQLFFDLEKMDIFAKDLESYGVNRQILFKYLPSSLFITPENEMSEIVKKIVLDHDFSTAESIKLKIQSYVSKETGPKTLGEQFVIGKFPLDSNILSLLNEKLKNTPNISDVERKNIISTALNLTELFTGRYRSNIGVNLTQETGDLEHFSILTKEAINDFISQEVEHFETDIIELFENFFNQFSSSFKENVQKYNVPVYLYAAKFILENPKNDPGNYLSNPYRRKLIINLLNASKAYGKDSFGIDINLNSFIYSNLAKLNSYDVHHSLKIAKSTQEKCKILEQYLIAADMADKCTFTQESLNQNIGAIALGEGLTFDFPILTKEYETCVNLRFHLCEQKNQLNSNEEDLVLEKDADCSIISEMAELINQIAEQSVLLEKNQGNI